MKSKIEKLILLVEEVISEMSYSRERFCDSTRDILRGALQEYTCYVISKHFNLKDDWSDEVHQLLSKIDQLMSKSIKTKFRDKEKALLEAIREASLSQDKISNAKSKMGNYYPKLDRKIHNLKLDSIELTKDMINEFLPQYKYLLLNYNKYLVEK